MGNCKRCGGRGYEKSLPLLYSKCHLPDNGRHHSGYRKKSVKPFFDVLITKFDIEEAWAEAQLKQNNAVRYLLFPNSC